MIKYIFNKIRTWALKDYFNFYKLYLVTHGDPPRLINNGDWFNYEDRKIQFIEQPFGPTFKNEYGEWEILDGIIQTFNIPKKKALIIGRDDSCKDAGKVMKYLKKEV